MKRPCILSILLIASFQALLPQPRGDVTIERLRNPEFAGDPLALRSLDPRFELFPDASLVDFSYLLEPPAGKHGFTRVGKNGRLEFADGKPARFWGVVIEGQDLFLPKYLIEKVVETLARAGVNLVRLKGGEGYAEEGGRGGGETIDLWDRIDYWIATAKKRGIYVSLMLETVVPSDSPYLTFSRKLMEIQKSAIDSLTIYHENPYTELSYPDEAAIAFFELDGSMDIFSKPGFWAKMPDKYRQEFYSQWNGWLEEQYRSTTRLKAAWTNSSGIVALGAEESLEKKNLRFPSIDETPFDQAILAPYHDPLRSPARRSDAVRFVMALRQSFCEQISVHCKRQGIRVPLLVSGGNDQIPISAVASHILGVTAGGSYHDYPTVSTRKEMAGQLLFSAGNPMSESAGWSFAPDVARTHWTGSPAVVKEWTACWPNGFRSASVLEVAAYSLFQGVDVVVHDRYATIGSMMSISTFGLQADPARWGLFGMAAKMFLSGDVRQAATTVAFVYSEEDLATFGSYESSMFELAWNHRVVNRFSEAEDAEADVAVSSGRSHMLGLEGENTILYARSPLVESKKQRVVTERNSLYARSGYPLKVYVRNDSMRVVLDSTTAFFVRPRFGFKVTEVEGRGLIPVGSDPTGTYTAGFLDTRRNVLGLGGLVDSQILPVILQHINRKSRNSTVPRSANSGVYESDTGELVRKTADGVFLIKTSQMSSVQGLLKRGNRYEAGALNVSSVSPVGTIAAASLDGKPLTGSSRVLIKMVTVAENSGQKLDSVTIPGIGKKFVVRSEGNYPVVTKGVKSDQPTTVWLDGRKILDVYLQNGTWEVLLDFGKKEYLIFCDTPNIRFNLFPDEPAGGMKLERHFYSRPPAGGDSVTRDFLYPGFSKYVRVAEE